MIDINEKYMKRCYELAISAGRKGFDTFGAVLVCDGKILEEAENTADFEKKVFGHAEFNLVHKCANKYTDDILDTLKEKNVTIEVIEDQDSFYGNAYKKAKEICKLLEVFVDTLMDISKMINNGASDKFIILEKKSWKM